MPKAERGTPKDIANRCKAKGLQKLKYFCQMCQKQCRDENGFQCHLTSDSHLRQMRLFSDNAHGMLDRFSNTFEKNYLDTLSRRHGTKRVNANNVYQEVIQDRLHVHMNSTRWTTLSDFVQYLGKKGLCVVDETERGWYVTYVDRDPALLARREAHERRIESERRQEELYRKRVRTQRRRAAEELDRIGGTVNVVASNMEREEGTDPVAVSLSTAIATKKTTTTKKKRKRTNKSVLDEDEDDGDDDTKKEKDDVVDNKQSLKINEPKTNVAANSVERTSTEPRIVPSTRNDADRADEKKKKKKKKMDRKGYEDDKKDRKDHWLHTGIYVKIVSKRLGAGFYKRKGVVDEIVDRYGACVEIVASSADADDGGDVVRVDQDDLETVIPTRLGRRCRIVNGEGRGRYAELVRIEERAHRADLRLLDAPDEGQILRNVDYEDFSKAE